MRRVRMRDGAGHTRARRRRGGHGKVRRVRGTNHHGRTVPGVRMGAGMSDAADRIRRNLDGTPERVANYLNSRAADDLRELLAEVHAARAAYMQAREARRVAEARLAALRDERDALRRQLGGTL